MNTNIKTARISALLPSALINEVKKESQLQNTTQSSVIKKALEFWLAHKLKKDLKELESIDFSDLPSEDDWLSIQSNV